MTDNQTRFIFDLSTKTTRDNISDLCYKCYLISYARYCSQLQTTCAFVLNTEEHKYELNTIALIRLIRYANLYLKLAFKSNFI